MLYAAVEDLYLDIVLGCAQGGGGGQDHVWHINAESARILP